VLEKIDLILNEVNKVIATHGLCVLLFLAGVIITFILCLILSIPFKQKSLGTRIDPFNKEMI